MKLKLSPILIFSILLIVLIVFVIFSSLCFVSEGFVSYHQKTPSLNQLYINQYADNKLVYKLYDSIYFDSINGNIIELFGIPFNESSTNQKKTTNVVDLMGTSLTDIILMSRSNTNDMMTISHFDNSVSELSVDKTLIENTMINTYNNYIHPNSSNFNINNSINYNYQVLYFSLGKDSIIHIYDCTNTNNVNIGTYLFRQSFDPVHFMNKGSIVSIGSPVYDNDSKNNTYISEPLYDNLKQNSLFQLTKNIVFDTSCRYLIIRKNNGDNISVYDGTVQNDGLTPNQLFSNVTEKDIITNTPSAMSHRNFQSFQVLYINDIEGGNFVLYMNIPSSKKTLIAVVSMDDKIPGFLKLVNVVIFNPDSENGLDGNTEVISPSNILVESNITIPKEVPPKEVSSKEELLKKVDEKLPYNHDFENDTESSIPSLDNIISDYYKKYWNQNLPVSTINGVKQYSNDFLLKTQIIPPICPSCPHLPTNITCQNCGKNGGGGSSFLNDVSLNDVSGNNVSINDVSGNDIPEQKTVPANTSTEDINKVTSNYKSILEPQKPTFDNRISSGTDNYSYYGTLSDRGTSDFIPITSDFSKFGR